VFLDAKIATEDGADFFPHKFFIDIHEYPEFLSSLPRILINISPAKKADTHYFKLSQ